MPCARNQGPRSQTGPEPLVFREVFAAVYAFSVKRFGFRSSTNNNFQASPPLLREAQVSGRLNKALITSGLICQDQFVLKTFKEPRPGAPPPGMGKPAERHRPGYNDKGLAVHRISVT
ncbi:hypothetical protein P8C59_004545 [Phyllachora maydis]|uniref:Uncharacterized protein n=1 Tax=Phyllachora maydis TaxID=1825666 RepID=A0AAD9MBD8_9PEZI|nr:hypothetical protein P8C59_004545 [Phyllachora maydis]